MKTYDFAVIGGGSAGYAAAAIAWRLGLKTCCIEGGKDVGGLCILRGCMPSKTFIESANRFVTLRRAQDYGLRTGKIGFEPGEILARKRRLVGEFAGYRAHQLRAGRFKLLRGRARFLDANRIEVQHLDSAGEPVPETSQVFAKTILISTGSVIDVIDLPGLAEAGFLTSDSVLESARMPASVVVLGGGAIALELAHYYEAFGSKVTIIQRSPQVLKEADADVAAALVHAYRQRGMEIFCGTRLLKVTPGSPRQVHFEYKDRTHIAEGEEILYALGRNPAVDGLELEHARIEQSRNGAVRVTSTMQTSQPHIFAAGDVTGTFEIVHVAIEQGVLAAQNAARLLRNEALHAIDYRLQLFVMFSEPQVAYAGLTEKAAAAQGVPIRTATYPFADHGKALIRGEPEGFVKLVCHGATGEILGGAVVGPEASELIHEIVVAMYFRATVMQLAVIPHYHPTLSEIWTYPAEELAAVAGR
ncbi:MAG: NAD(P)/FAD-dependent oxidoreductase [Verrucomicrobia bacterium]|nr:NAD(P)/FAD-dependent oxidoreductase [Verrucomicrobiota bacterium]